MHSKRLRQVFLIALGWVSSAAVAAPVDKPLPATIDFNRDIRPIFSENCYACHGPDKNKRKADLRLDTHDGLFSSHDNKPDVVAGKPDESELFRRITTNNADDRMPDPKSNKRLTDRQIALVKKWIEQGAAWKGHWAYIEPTRPTPPAADDPAFVKNPIDAFIVAGLKDAGLRHAPEADRRTLIRRLSFDLTGLPPTEEQVVAFEKDSSPNAYEAVVDRLLASPRFGERMATWWLDLVRYADSIGYHSDNPMNVWPYRDYVIGAFNANEPFDQFVREQIAGDLLPNATERQKIASAYNRLIETTEEGGAQPKEYEIKYECDRVRNVSTVFMAATMGCSQCHDHKFDPYTQKDFYSLAAFFGDIQEASVGRREPGMPITDEAHAVELKKLEDAIVEGKKKLETSAPELAAAQVEWEKHQADQATWVPLDVIDARVDGESKLQKQPDGSLKSVYKVAAKENYHVTARVDLKGITGIQLQVLDDADFPAHGPGTAPNGNFVLTSFKLSAKSADGKTVEVPLARVSADHSQDGYPVESVLDHGKGGGWAILPQTGKSHTAVFETGSPALPDGSAQVEVTLEFQSPFPQHNIARFKLAATTAASPASQSLPGDVKAALAVETDKRTDAQKQTIAAYYRTIAPSLAGARDELKATEKKKADLLASLPTCLVSISGPPRQVKFLHRGNWQDDTGDVESPAVPHFLPQPSAKKDRLSRLDLADWLVDEHNPLTARVFVNRFWMLFFGTGISKSVDDLGSQGESPVNPELLDWLATEFHQSKWDVKHVVKLIVMSGTYRQSSAATAEDNEIDPFNRLCSHQTRHRLEAEMIRDSALQISGLLSTKMGGPSVKPYQPAGFWDPLNFPARTYEASTGEDQYRRGVYTWWQRTFPHPSLTAFDEPSREEGTCERLRSNIPQQALVLLNDPTYVESARVFAARVMKEGGASPADRIAWAYRTVLNRDPRPDEAKLLVDLYQKHLGEYANDKDSAKKLIATGQAPVPADLDPAELAAWTSVSRVIINLSETITRS